MRGPPMLLAAYLLSAGVATLSGGEAPVWVAKVVRRLPRTEAELAAAYHASKDACVPVPAGDPLYLPEIGEETFYDVTLPVDGQPRKVKRRFEFARLGVLSFGSQIRPDDEAQLPSLSKSRILSRIQGEYISIQLRLHRDAETGAVYLYHKPIAAVGGFGDTQTAREFAAVMEDSVRQIRGLGLFLDPDREQVEADDLRTFVAVNLTTIVGSASGDEAASQVGGFAVRPSYRLIFVRAREAVGGMRLHTFVTSEDRKTLAYLPQYELPASAEACTVTSEIVFTGYTAAKQSPTGKVSRTLTVHDAARYPLEALDHWMREQGFSGGALDHLTVALDAVIDGRAP